MQEKALEKWELQKASWAELGKRLGEKVGRPGSQSLHNTSHQWRERGEELDSLTASVPQAARSSAGWEMSLRSQADGVRYVKFGTDYPYPLYCPIPNKDGYPAEGAAYTKIIPAQPSGRVPLSKSSKYFQRREKQYKKHIVKKFPHRAGEGDGQLIVQAISPPRTTEEVTSNVTSSIQHFQFVGEATSDTTAVEPNADTPQSVSLSLSDNQSMTQDEPPYQGPLLLLDSERLSFSSVPGELSHRPLKATNLGSTAVYYCWKPVVKSELRNSKGGVCETSNPPFKFLLAENNSGVLLPGDENGFSFFFRSAKPCVASQAWELQTVPSGRDKITVMLRGVCTTQEHDELSVKYLVTSFANRTNTHIANRLVLDILNKKSKDNPFSVSDRQQAERDKKTPEELKAEQSAKVETNKAKFTEQNKGLNLWFSPESFRDFEKLYEKTSPGSTWDGAVATIQAGIEGLTDRKARSDMFCTLRAMKAAAAHEPSTQYNRYLYSTWYQVVSSIVCEIPEVSTAAAISLGLMDPLSKPNSKNPPAGKSKQPAKKTPISASGDGLTEEALNELHREKTVECVKTRMYAGISEALHLCEKTVQRVEGL
eukprot:TRINITY_DN4411_c2_g1_i1.p1 TRINITY_DN4411_c2_g1~~TRINITY_DN4411_c2_g1_i1.p1  ORF type:complete len:611 (+),score=66.76 TRINITY_DN4411_c2_g1_i1:46-1833(+)